MKRTWGRAAVALVLVLGVGACGDDDTTATGDGATTTEAPPDGTTTTTAPAGEPTSTTAFVVAELTPSGLVGLQVGMTEEEAVASGLVEPFEPTCEEIAGPGYSMAELVAPYEGYVIANDGAVERLTFRTANVVTAPGGVAVGDDVDQATAAFEAAGLTATLDTSLEDSFGSWFLRVTEGEADRFEAAVDPEARTVETLSAPQGFACE